MDWCLVWSQPTYNGTSRAPNAISYYFFVYFNNNYTPSSVAGIPIHAFENYERRTSQFNVLASATSRSAIDKLAGHWAIIIRFAPFNGARPIDYHFSYAPCAEQKNNGNQRRVGAASGIFKLATLQNRRLWTRHARSAEANKLRLYELIQAKPKCQNALPYI